MSRRAARPSCRSRSGVRMPRRSSRWLAASGCGVRPSVGATVIVGVRQRHELRVRRGHLRVDRGVVGRGVPERRREVGDEDAARARRVQQVEQLVELGAEEGDRCPRGHVVGSQPDFDHVGFQLRGERCLRRERVLQRGVVERAVDEDRRTRKCGLEHEVGPRVAEPVADAVAFGRAAAEREDGDRRAGRRCGRQGPSRSSTRCCTPRARRARRPSGRR